MRLRRQDWLLLDLLPAWAWQLRLRDLRLRLRSAHAAETAAARPVPHYSRAAAPAAPQAAPAAPGSQTLALPRAALAPCSQARANMLLPLGRQPGRHLGGLRPGRMRCQALHPPQTRTTGALARSGTVVSACWPAPALPGSTQTLPGQQARPPPPAAQATPVPGHSGLQTLEGLEH